MARKKKYDYFKTFEEQAKTVIEEAELLVEVIENFSSADDIKAVLPKAHEIENRGDQLNHENYNAVAVDFVTPIDREDLIDISSSLDSIIDQMEETIMEFYMLHIHSMHESCLEFARCARGVPCPAYRRPGLPELQEVRNFPRCYREGERLRRSGRRGVSAHHAQDVQCR